MRGLRQGVAAGVMAGLWSGLPSTAHAVVTGADPLAATRAAGWMVAPRARGLRLLGTAAAVHMSLSMGWGALLGTLLPRRHEVAWGAVAGAAIAAVDLGVVGRRIEPIAALPTAPQVADHLAYGALVGLTLRRLRARDAGTVPPPG